VDLVLCHTTADFDTLGAAVGLAHQQPGSRIVLPGGAHPGVQQFLALHRDAYPLIERRAVEPQRLRSLTLVDAQQRHRFGPAAVWIDLALAAGLPLVIYDHHVAAHSDIPVLPDQRRVEAVGAVTTLVVEALQQAHDQTLTGAEATAMALGIHSDTGSLTYDLTTARDARALAWLLEQGASLEMVAEFAQPSLTPALQALLPQALEHIQTQVCGDYTLAWVYLALPAYQPGLSTLTERLTTLVDCDALLLAASHAGRSAETTLTVVGRLRGRLAAAAEEGTPHLGHLFEPWGGGGHRTAASLSYATADPEPVLATLVDQLQAQLPTPLQARDLMSAPVRTILPHTTIHEAQRILLRYGHAGLSVVDDQGTLVGVISRRDLDLADHHGFSHAPVKGYMTTPVRTIAPTTPLSTIEALMTTYDIGRLPVLEGRQLVGIVTRTDLLRHRHRKGYTSVPSDWGMGTAGTMVAPPPAAVLVQRLARHLSPVVWQILQHMAAAAQQRGWHLYLVGGAVRDVLRWEGTASQGKLWLPDIDLVVDGFAQAATEGAGVELAQTMKQAYPDVQLQVHGRFQTAALVWSVVEAGKPAQKLLIDVATARTEFYPYPAANPEVEASSIRQDLYRRDFTINAMAIRLTPPQAGLLLDYFGGLDDLQQRQVRVLHANSFIEDPTRMFRAVRFTVRLGFTLDGQTRQYIHHAIESGIYTQLQEQVVNLPALQVRLKQELRYILAASYWQPALHLLDQLGALRCLHDGLRLTPDLWRQIGRIGRWVDHFGWQHTCPPWQMRLEVLLATLPEEQRGMAAAALQLGAESQERQRTLAEVEERLQAALAQPLSPSQIYRLLHPLPVATLLLVSVRHPRPVGRQVWAYLTRWAHRRAPLNGHDLKAMGYRPGPQFRHILDDLLAAILDGQITTAADATHYVAEHYPLPRADAKS